MIAYLHGHESTRKRGLSGPHDIHFLGFRQRHLEVCRIGFALELDERYCWEVDEIFWDEIKTVLFFSVRTAGSMDLITTTAEYHEQCENYARDYYKQKIEIVQFSTVVIL